MDNDKCVLDISSDEEIDVQDQHVNLDWFRGHIFKDVDDSDDVVIIGEVLSAKQIEGKCLIGGVDVRNVDEIKGQEKEEDDEDEDDCVVLDDDPDKMVSVEENKNDGSDELVVVGEKGQVACRDYPHPRHLCVKYPFSSTLHKFHCELCHCYVCDAVAPCNLWGSGMSIADHCHATDKQEVWKTERKNFKLKRCSSLPHMKMSETSVPSTESTQTPNQPHPLTRSITMPSDNLDLFSTPSVPSFGSVPSPPAFGHVPYDSAVRPPPLEPNLNTTNIMYPRSGSYRLPHSSISNHPPGGYTKYVSPRVRYQNATGLGPQHMPFKRTMNDVAYHFRQLHSSVDSYIPLATQSQQVRGESFNRDHHPHQWMNSVSHMNNGTVRRPSPQSHYENIPRTAAVSQGSISNRSATESTPNVSQQVTYPSVMIPNVLVPWVDSTNLFPSPLQANFASNHVTSNTDSSQWDQLQPTETSSNPNTSTPRTYNSNSSQSDQHSQLGALGVHIPQSVNPTPEIDDLRFEFEDWLMNNQSAICNPTEPPFFSDQNILSPDDAHVDSALLDEWSLLANVTDI